MLYVVYFDKWWSMEHDFFTSLWCRNNKWKFYKKKEKKKRKEIINGSFLMVWRLGVPTPPPPPRKVIELQCIWDKGVLEAIYVRICENLFPMFNVVHLE